MTTEQLLIPRVRVIAGYFGSEYWVGQIITLDQVDTSGGPFYIEYKGDEIPCEWRYESDYKEYPHLFQPIPWYQDREIGDMPEYLKSINHNSVHKVKAHYASEIVFMAMDGGWKEYEFYLPATLEQYTAYKLTAEGQK